MRTFFLFLGVIFTSLTFGQSSISFKPVYGVMGSPLVNFSQFETLTDSVEHYRENRLISAQDFVAFSKEKNTIILDTRSRKFFDQKHVKGAINLPFAEFTQDNLEALIPDKTTRILIYCNNNFAASMILVTAIDVTSLVQDPSFASKVSRQISYDIKAAMSDSNRINKIKFNTHESFKELPVLWKEAVINKTYTLALNIPTFINLYGYGYQNIYELKDIIATSSSDELQFEGTNVDPNQIKAQLFVSNPSSPLVSYTDLQELVDLVKPHREERLITLDQFNQMKLEENTIILDTRSKEMYDAKHVKGAVHLEFSEFTQSTLDVLTGGDRNKRILIYCNNNFITDLEKNQQDRYFMSKVALSPPKFMNELTLALNIPTYINLYGYGFQNVYELNELVVTSDPRIQFEGSSIK